MKLSNYWASCYTLKVILIGTIFESCFPLTHERLFLVFSLYICSSREPRAFCSVACGELNQIRCEFIQKEEYMMAQFMFVILCRLELPLFVHI